MSTVHAHEAVGSLLEHEKERLVRLWSKRLLDELSQAKVSSRELQKSLSSALHELLRLLKNRPEEAPRLWAESLRPHAIERYAQKFSAEDLVREMKVFQQVMMFVYGKRRGLIEPEVAELVTELIHEASAALQASYVRMLRAEEVRLKQASLMDSILHHLDLGIWLAEPDGSIVYATPGTSLLMGLEPSAVIGNSSQLAETLSRLQARHLDGKPYRVADMPFQRVLQSQKAIVGENMAITRAQDAQEVIVEMSAMPVMEQSTSPRVVGVVQTLTDRTQSLHKTAELSRAYAELRDLQTKWEVQTRRNVKSQLAAQALRHIRELICSAKDSAAQLNDKMPSAQARDIGDSVENMAAWLEHFEFFLDAHEAGVAHDFELDALVAQALDLAQMEGMPMETLFHWHVQLQSAAKVRVEGPLLRELMLCLLHWAAERSPKDKVVFVQTHSEQGFAHFRVQDEGEPLPESEIQQLREVFRRPQGASWRALFLSLGQEHIRRWGGEVNFQNLQPGWVCDIRLPCV